MKKICVSVSNDLYNDNRVLKTCHSLAAFGLGVSVIGKQTRNEQSHKNEVIKALPDETNLYYIKPVINKNFFYYAELNIRLFFYLLFHKQDILWANDLDTLPANYLAAKIKKKPLIFDSHEMFAYTAELKEGSFQQRFWLKLEKILVPKLKYVFTVCEPIKDYFKKKYNITAHVVRNIPLFQESNQKAKEYPLKDISLVWQGAANVDRGVEEMVLAMQYIEADLYIIGRGDILDKINKIIKQNNLSTKVHLLGRQPFEKMMYYTRKATLGISLDKPTNKNYNISLPNKIFEYINCATPVIASRLPEIEKIINAYNTGVFINSYESKELAEQINNLLADNKTLQQLSDNCIKAQKDLCWQNEEKEIQKVLNEIFHF